MIPQVSREDAAADRVCAFSSTPALASTNSGTIT